MKPISQEDIATLVAVVGRDGAVSALEHSRVVKSEDLAMLAKSIGTKIVKTDNKNKLAKKVVRHVDKRIVISIDQLKKMSKDELIQYFEQVQCDQDELIELLQSIDLRSRAKSRRELLEFASIQISSLGVFERLAGHRS